LMNAVKAKPTFQLLVMSEESRLGREAIETSYALKQIIDAGVRVFLYLTDTERKLETAMDKLMNSIEGFGSEVKRERASVRTHDAMLRKAKAGYVTGCKVYGYDNVDIAGPCGERSHVVRKINVDEAKVVRRLFESYADGTYGLAGLAKALNAEGVPPPHGDQHGWCPTAIRDMLRRELYSGVVVWNRTQTIMRGGTKASRQRPESEWARLPHNPELAIIPSALWVRVQALTERRRGAYARLKNGRLIGRPTGADLRSDYLLSGLAMCSLCEGSLVMQKRIRNPLNNTYMCLRHAKRGLCPNALHVKQSVLDQAVLQALVNQLDESMIADAVTVALEQLRQAATSDDQSGLSRALASIEGKIYRYVTAIGDGKATESVYVELRRLEAEKAGIQARLANLDRIVSLDPKRVACDLRERVKDIKGVLARNVPQARPMLRRLLQDEIVNGRYVPGRIRCMPFEDKRGRGYEVTAIGNYAGLFGDGIEVVNFTKSGTP
ncbi:MAG: recombinase family protein, partial [Nitrospirota bacterium]